MKILLFTHYYEPELGAPQRRWSGLISRWQKAGHQVTVYCPSPHYPDRNSTAALRHAGNKPWSVEVGRYGESIHRMPYILHGYSGGVRFVDQIFTSLVSGAASLYSERKNNYDVVISTVPGLPSSFAGQMVARRKKIPHVLDLRDAWPDILVGDAETPIDYSAKERIVAGAKAFVGRSLAKSVRKVQHQADLLVTTTYSFAQILRKRGLENIETVTNGADPEQLIATAQRTNTERPYLQVQYLGTIGRSQGLTVLLRALRKLKERSQGDLVKLRFIGEGADLPNLKSYAEKHGLDVEFCPPVPHEELAEAYSWADINIVSLRKAKVFEWTVPSKIFELISTRRRIIGLVDGEAARLLMETRAGDVLPPGDAVALADKFEELAQNQQKLTMSDYAFNMLQKEYSYDVLAEKYVQLLEKVVADS